MADKRKIVWPFIAARRLFGWLLRFLDEHDGSITALATVAIVVLTFVYVKYSKRQWQAMNGQLEEMRKSTKAAQDAAETAKDTLKLTYRPRITITKIYPQENLDNGKLAVGFSVLNYGPITARNVRVFRFENVSDLDHASRLPYGKQPLRDYPKMLAPTKADDWEIYGEKILSSQQIQSLARRDDLPITPSRQVATFSVLVEYQGDLPEIHHAEACILFTLPPQRWWTYCPWPAQID